MPIDIRDAAGTTRSVRTKLVGSEHSQGALLTGEAVDFWPAYHGSDTTTVRDAGIDPDGALVTRGAVLTDEGTVRVNFANSSLAVSIGTATFTNGSATVTGTGFLGQLFAANVGDYVKLDADAESAWAQIDTIDSDTSLTLVANYGGTGGTGASSRTIVKPATGSGGSIAVASGVATLTAGTTATSVTQIGRLVDYAPLIVQSGVTVSQRIANQDLYVGAWHESATPRWYAWFRINGTTNTTVICESGRNPSGAPSASEIESTTVTLPNAGTTAAARRYRVEMLVDKCRFFIDSTLVAEHQRAVPAPHDEMFTGVRIVNGTTPASSTTVTVDYLTAINVNKLTMALLSDSENVVASPPPATDTAYSVAGVIAINTVLVQLDCSQLRALSIQCISMGTTGVVTPEWSNDGTTWVAATILTQAGATAATFNAAGMWTTQVLARNFRLRLSTATTAGTTTLRVAGFATPAGPLVAQPVSGTVAVTGTVGVTGYPTAAASADALANPTVTKIDATTLLFNGTTWDRARGNFNSAIEASSAKTATGNGATQTNFNAAGIMLWGNVTAVSGTTPTLTVRVQWSPDGGTNWVDLDTTNAQTASITGTGTFVLRIYPGMATAANASLNSVLPRTWRLAWTIGGTTPSFTFTVQGAYVN